MTNTKQSELSVEDILAVCGLWGMDWERWDKKSQQHMIENFKHSPNFKEGLAKINQLIITEGRKMAEYAIGEDYEHSHPTRVYCHDCQYRDDHNGIKRGQRTRLDRYIKENYGE